MQQGRQRDLDNIELFGAHTIFTLSKARQRGLKLLDAIGLMIFQTMDGDPTAVR